MIFGYKQQGKPGEKAQNLYYPLTYEERFKEIIETTELDSQESILHQVIHFGQTPIQVFSNPHPTKDDIKQKVLINERILSPKFFQVKPLQEFDTPFIFLQNRSYFMILKYSTNYVLETFKIGPDDNELTKIKEIELKDLPFNSKIIAAIFKEKFIVTAGFHDSCFYQSNLNGELINKLKFHSEPISCIVGGNYLASGSLDSTIVLWDESQKFSLFGHLEPIKFICLMENFCMLVSVSRNKVLFHDTQTHHLINRLNVDCSGLAGNDSGCVVLETIEAFEIYNINARKINQITKVNNPKFCLAEDTFILIDSDAICIFDVYEGKNREIELENASEVSEIVFDKIRDHLFILSKNQYYNLNILTD